MSAVRGAGIAAMVLAAAALSEAVTFRVRFLTDPLGPRGFPFLAAGLLLVAGAALAWRPQGAGVADAAVEVGGSEADLGRGSEGRRIPPSLLLAAGLLAYAFAIPWLGFVTSTMLVLFVTALLFGGPPRPAVAGSGILALGLWLLFDRALGVYLAPGMVWEALGRWLGGGVP